MVMNIGYDEKSDVYSFGICLWELYTRKIPYRELNLNPSHLVVRVVKEGLRPPIPKYMPRPYAKLMEKCWHPNQAKRPAFAQILKVLETFNQDPVMLNHKPNSAHGAAVFVSSPVAASSTVDAAAHMRNDLSQSDNAWKIGEAEMELLAPPPPRVKQTTHHARFAVSTQCRPCSRQYDSEEQRQQNSQTERIAASCCTRAAEGGCGQQSHDAGCFHISSV